MLMFHSVADMMLRHNKTASTGIVTTVRLFDMTHTSLFSQLTMALAMVGIGMSGLSNNVTMAVRSCVTYATGETAAMFGLVIANSLLLLFMCWEVVGLTSYLLIGFWYHRPAAAAEPLIELVMSSSVALSAFENPGVL